MSIRDFPKFLVSFSEYNGNITSKTRNYFVKIYFDTYNVYILDSDYDAGSAGDVVFKSSLENLPSSFSQELDIYNSNSTISDVSFEVKNYKVDENDIDTEYTFSKFIYQNLFSKTETMINRKCEVVLYENLTTETIIFTGKIKNFSCDSWETYYTIEIQDIKRELKNIVFQKTSLGLQTFDITTLVSDIPIVVLPVTPATGEMIKIGRKKSENQNAVGTITGIFGYDETHDDAEFTAWGDVEKWYVLIFDGTPAALLDIIELNFGYNIGDLIDATSKNAVMNDTKNQKITSLHWEFKEPLEDAWEFIQNEILRVMNCYAYIGETDGKIYLRIQKQPLLTDIIETFDDSNVIDVTENTNDIDNLVNNVMISCEHNSEENNFLYTVWEFDDNEISQSNTDTSIEVFGLKPESPETIELKGLNSKAVFTSGSYKTYASDIASYLFNRLSNCFKYIKLEVFFDVGKPLKVGDFVFLELSKFVSWRYTRIGKRGLESNTDDDYAKIDLNSWADYVTTYESNTCLFDTYDRIYTETGAVQANETILGITENNIYDVITEDLYSYTILDDDKNVTAYNKTSFDCIINQLDDNYAEYIKEPILFQETTITLPNTINTAITNKIRTTKTITLNFFKDMLENYKVNKNFAEYVTRDFEEI